MATWITADGAFAAGVGSLIYSGVWVGVRDRSRGVKWGVRAGLLVVIGTFVARVFVGGPGSYAHDHVTSPERQLAQGSQVDRPLVSMAAPEAVEPRRISEPESGSRSTAAQGDPGWDVVRVFYGTDRALLPTFEPRCVYGASRSGRLAIGHVDVTVPKAHEQRRIERPWAVRLPFMAATLIERGEDPQHHFTIRAVAALSQEAFISLVRERLAAAKLFRERAVVFVHGYNTDFDFAVYRTAQMAYDLAFDGAAFLYSWPSASGVTSYVYDRDSAEQSEPHLSAFLDLVVRESGAKKITLIAHSMGNRPLLRVFRTIETRLPEDVRIDQVILAAPDVDRDLFEQLARGITRPDRGVTLYASSNDRAMVAARLIAGGVPRAGDVPPGGPVVVPGIDTIDISQASVDTFVLNHSLYAQSRMLIGDIGMLIATGLRPPELRLPGLVRVKTAKGDYWRYP